MNAHADTKKISGSASLTSNAEPSSLSVVASVAEHTAEPRYVWADYRPAPTPHEQRKAAIAEMARRMGREIRYALTFERPWPRGGDETVPMHFATDELAGRYGRNLCNAGVAATFWVKPLLVLS